MSNKARIASALERIADALEAINFRQLKKEVKIMFIVKDDNPDVRYSIAMPTVTDSEGHDIPDAVLTFEVTSDNADIVQITPDAENPRSGDVHFGAPGLANVNVQVKSGDTLLGSFGAQFTVTAGDPAAISGGGISFAGLTEA